MEKDWDGDPKLTIMQRREKKFLFWKWTSVSRTRYSDWVWGGVTKINIQKVAERLIEKRGNFIDADRSSLFGDYPPKTLLEA